MTTTFRNRLFCAALLLSSLQLGVAQTGTNLMTFSFGPPLTPVYDISGGYQITNLMQGSKIAPMLIVFNGLELTVDAHGHIKGSGTIPVGIGADFVGGDYKANGNMTGGGTQIKAKFSVHYKGNGVVAGVLTTANINVNYNLTINPQGGTMVGTSSGNANLSHLGSGSLKNPVSLPLPAGVDGGWTVTLDIFPFNTKLTGTAAVQVDNTPPTLLATKANGNLPKNSAQAKLKLNGFGNSSGTVVNMQFIPIFGATNVVSVINGKVLGQKVKN